MTQHFLLTAKARTLSPIKIARLSDGEAFSLLCDLRWGSEKEVICPKCGCKHHAYFISTRKQWRCKYCKHTFSVTSGTIFANHKLPIQTYLFAIALFVNAVKGVSALQLARDLNVQYKTAFVLAHKLRHSIAEQRKLFPLMENEVHIDGTYIHTSPRPKNKKVERVDRRLKENANPNKRSVIVVREAYSDTDKIANSELKGAKHTRIFTTLSETSSVVHQIANSVIATGTRIHADENPAYDELLVKYDLQRVNHQKEYRSDFGVTNNLAESYFARFKRMYYGQVHLMSNENLALYAEEIAYREDSRRQDNGSLFEDVLEKCLATPDENNWCGYWQGKHISRECLVM